MPIKTMQIAINSIETVTKGPLRKGTVGGWGVELLLRSVTIKQGWVE